MDQLVNGLTDWSLQVTHTVTGTLALLRSNHPEDCMSCDVNGKCEFQDLISMYKVPKWPKLKEVSEDYIEHTAHWHLYDQVGATAVLAACPA